MEVSIGLRVHECNPRLIVEANLTSPDHYLYRLRLERKRLNGLHVTMRGARSQHPLNRPSSSPQVLFSKAHRGVWKQDWMGNQVACITVGCFLSICGVIHELRTQGGQWPSSFRCRSIMIRCWKFFGDSRDEFCVASPRCGVSGSSATSYPVMGSDSEFRFACRRMRAVIG